MAISARVPRVALVTGGAKRIGRALVEMLSAQGFAVAIHYRRSEAEAAALLAQLGGRGGIFQADLADEKAVSALLPQVERSLGPVGLLVNNASLFERDTFGAVTRASWDRHMEANLRAPFVLSQAMACSLPAEAEGLILNLLDQRVWNLTPHFVSYTVSKSALWTLTQSMALGFAPQIRVNAIGPGFTLPAQGQDQAQFEAAYQRMPLRRCATPQEVAQAALALFSLPSVTGQMLALDGGQHLNWGPVPS